MKAENVLILYMLFGLGFFIRELSLYNALTSGLCIYLWPILFHILFTPDVLKDRSDKINALLVSFVPIFGNVFVTMALDSTQEINYALSKTHVKYLAYLPFLLLPLIFLL